MSSNASKEWSGKKAGFINKRDKFTKTLEMIQKQHKENDQKNLLSEEENKKYKKRIAKVQKKIKKLTEWLETNNDKHSLCSQKGHQKIIQSKISDNESAKMQSSNGIIQGYNCQAVVDSKHQIICYSEPLGQSNDHKAFIPSVEGVKRNLQNIGKNNEDLKSVNYLADTGYHNAETLKFIDDKKLKAIVPDSQYRLRDPRFSSKQRHVRPYNSNNTKPSKRLSRSQFKYDKEKDVYICPQNHILKSSGNLTKVHGQLGTSYNSLINRCKECSIKEKCLSPRARMKTIFIKEYDDDHPGRCCSLSKVRD